MDEKGKSKFGWGLGLEELKPSVPRSSESIGEMESELTDTILAAI
jgi:hypothetical protein